jgi:iron-sulfur cluster assembly accessory protein
MNRTVIVRSVRAIQNARQPCKNKLGFGKQHSHSFTSQVQPSATRSHLGPLGGKIHGIPVPLMLQQMQLQQPGPASLSANQFSSAATAPASESESESEPSPRAKTQKRIQKKSPIVVTETAAERIKELLSSPNGKNALGIRLGVKRRGCNGLSYTLNYAMERQSNEEELTAHGVTVFIEPMALFSVIGTVMDYEVTDMSTEFTFQNPNSKGECGCGESFNV